MTQTALDPRLEIKSTPPAGAVPSPSVKIPYILYYRQGNNPHSQFLVFNHHSNDMHIIVDRAKRHCDTMNYRFVSVRPLVVDLDLAEQRLTGD